jgi:hypothetical protein
MERSAVNDLDGLRQRFDHEAWRGANRLEEELFVHRFLPPPDLLEGWIAARTQLIETADWPRTIESIWQPPEGGRERLLRVDFFECASRDDAHDFLIRLLANFQSPEIKRDEDGKIGDVAFTGPGRGLALFARANLVLAVRNAGPEVVAVGDAAQQVDAELIARPPKSGDVVPQIARFEAGHVAGGDVRLEVDVSDPLDRPVWLKLFTRGGAVAREDGSLILRPSGKDATHVTLFASNENRGVASATLELPGLSPGLA